MKNDGLRMEEELELDGWKKVRDGLWPKDRRGMNVEWKEKNKRVKKSLDTY